MDIQKQKLLDQGPIYFGKTTIVDGSPFVLHMYALIGTICKTMEKLAKQIVVVSEFGNNYKDYVPDNWDYIAINEQQLLQKILSESDKTTVVVFETMYTNIPIESLQRENATWIFVLGYGQDSLVVPNPMDVRHLYAYGKHRRWIRELDAFA